MVNKGSLNRKGKLLALINPSWSIRAVEPEVPVSTHGEKRDLSILPYDGNNSNVWGAKEFLDRHLKNDLYAAFVHGSLATNDEVTYSDFDGLIIIKDEVFGQVNRCTKVLKLLNQSLRYLRRQDLLQHHGWMLLSERSLANYDPHFLPLETLQCAQSIFGVGTTKLEVTLSNTPGSSIESLQTLIGSIRNKLGHERLLKSAYFLKVFLSELMLLPAILWQTLNKNGIYKRDSFDQVKPMFSDEEWQAIVIASSLRMAWPVYKSGWVEWVNTRNTTLASELAKRKTWPIPDHIKGELNGAFFESTQLFVNKCQSLIIR